MKITIKGVLKAVGLVVLAIALFVGFSVWRNWDTIQRTMLGGVKVYETEPPILPDDIKRPAILVFSKTNGFRHVEAIPVANDLFRSFAQEQGWGFYQTENGATFSPEILSRFDAIIFNNVSGDVFTEEQRAAFREFIESGRGFVGIHAAGDSSHEAWPWYMDAIVGTKFIGHPMDPQFQEARVVVEDRDNPATRDAPEDWRRTDEWYSFDKSPRREGVHVLATIDEQSYEPGSLFGRELAMGSDHPIVWWRCAGKGRVLYSAMGHTAQSYDEPEYRQLLLGATRWALRLEGEGCGASLAVSDEEGQPE